MEEWMQKIINSAEFKKNGGKHYLVSRCRCWAVQDDDDEVWEFYGNEGICENLHDLKEYYNQACKELEYDRNCGIMEMKDALADSKIMISVYDEKNENWEHGVHLPGINDSDFLKKDIDEIREIISFVADDYEVSEIRLDNYYEVNESETLCLYQFYAILDPGMYDPFEKTIDSFICDLKSAMSFNAIVYIDWSDRMNLYEDEQFPYIVAYKKVM